jgi:hypothetical protein
MTRPHIQTTRFDFSPERITTRARSQSKASQDTCGLGDEVDPDDQASGRTAHTQSFQALNPGVELAAYISHGRINAAVESS